MVFRKMGSGHLPAGAGAGAGGLGRSSNVICMPNPSIHLKHTVALCVDDSIRGINQTLHLDLKRMN